MDKITPDELQYLQKVVAQANGAQAIAQAYTRHLSEKYTLAEGDTLNVQTGEVMHKPAENVTQLKMPKAKA